MHCSHLLIRLPRSIVKQQDLNLVPLAFFVYSCFVLASAWLACTLQLVERYGHWHETTQHLFPASSAACLHGWVCQRMPQSSAHVLSQYLDGKSPVAPMTLANSPQHLRWFNNSLQRLRGHLCLDEFVQLLCSHPSASPHRQKEHHFWTVQNQGCVGTDCECHCLWLHYCMVCHLLLPIRLAGGCTEHELFVSDLGWTVYFRCCVVVHWGKKRLCWTEDDWRYQC